VDDQTGQPLPTQGQLGGLRLDSIDIATDGSQSAVEQTRPH
jgi:hypothetical protein